VTRAYRLLRRGMWLRRLENSCVVYREPASELSRSLVLRQGEIVESSDVAPGQPPLTPAEPGSSPRSFGQGTPPSFDRAKYDRMRVLSSELERVRRDGGSVSVYVASRRLGERVLDGIFGWT
jgi:hypothetical protein